MKKQRKKRGTFFNKVSLVLKLSFLLFLVNAIQVSASVYSQNTSISIDIKDASVEQVFEIIKSQSEFKFLYKTDEVDIQRKVSLSLSNVNVEEVLDVLFSDTDIEFRIIKNQIILMKKGSGPEQNIEITIRGIVTDIGDGSPIPGVTIIAKGSNEGAITDVDGNYTIKVGSGQDILVFSFIGYQTQEIPINGRTVIDVVMLQSVSALDEVIVIGYGTQKKSDLTGSIASINADNFKNLPALQIEDAMQGKAAGVQITSNSGAPGAGVTVRIRGTGTVNSSDPLYVVDGLQIGAGGIDFLNPSDIASIEILKDASAAAIYGARGANGVVLVTTKQGEAGKSKISFDSYYGIQNQANTRDMLNAVEYVTLVNEFKANNDRAPLKDYDTPEELAALIGTDWQKEIMNKNAPVESHNLSFSGGSESGHYLISANYFKQDGTIKKSEYERFSLRINSANKFLNNRITVGENIALTRAIKKSVSEYAEWSILGSAIRADPTIQPYDSITGNWNSCVLNTSTNPVGTIDRLNSASTDYKLAGSVFIEVELLKGLKLKSNNGVDLSFNDYFNFSPKYEVNPAEKSDFSGLYKNNSRYNYWQSENTLSYDLNLDKHNFSFLLGATAQEFSWNNLSASGSNLPENPDMWYISATDLETRITQESASSSAMFSLLGRMFYSYNNKYLLTATFRRDGSSKFGKNNPYGTFPSFAFGWKLHNETFMENIPSVSVAKLRLGWGKIGNENIGNYPFITTIKPNMNYIFGKDPVLFEGAGPVSLANEDIKWEETVTANIGLDLGMFNNRLTINTDYFIKRTNDMLVELPVSSILGLSTPPTVNAGNIENKGIEVLATYRNKIGELGYTIGGNITFVKNKVTSLGEGGEPLYNRTSVIIGKSDIDHPIASFYGYEFDGIWQESDDLDGDGEIGMGEQPSYVVDSIEFLMFPRATPGDAKYMDLNDNNRLDEEDMTYIGNPNPDFYYGINLGLDYKNFDFSLFLQGTYGNEILDYTMRYTQFTGATWNMDRAMLDSWTPENQSNTMPKLGGRRVEPNSMFSSRYIKDGSYLRVKNIQLGYTFPEALSSKAKIQRFRVYVSANNLYTFTNYDGADPEISQSGRGSLDIGVDRGIYPQPRTIMFGVNLSF